MSHTFDLIGVGAPIMDLVAPVPDSFLVHVSGDKGGMVMVEADEMERIVARLPAQPHLTPGGSAANTTFNAARLGLRTAFVGKLGGDDLARLYQDRFALAGVHTGRFKHHPDLPNARCLALTTPDAQRTMRTCLGAVMSLSPSEVQARDFEGARHVHVEGYVVFNQALADAFLDSARAAGATVGLSLASFEVVGAARPWLLRQFERGLAIVFANEDEARVLYPDLPAKGPDDYAAHARRLAEFGGTVAITLGKDGAWVARGNELHRIAPQAVSDAIDTNGAGDAWAAGFLYGHLQDWPLPPSGALASLVAAETVRHLGPIIPDSHWPDVHRRARQHAPQK
jgi:sugar/nucleoside kinase (ribokinase family)